VRQYVCDDDFTNIRPATMDEWSANFSRQNRQVIETIAEDGSWRVSTVWLGIDHRNWGDGPPLLFETMIFSDGLPCDNACRRCANVDDALLAHSILVREVKAEALSRKGIE
jgi:hypothetical protein